MPGPVDVRRFPFQDQTFLPAQRALEIKHLFCAFLHIPSVILFISLSFPDCFNRIRLIDLMLLINLPFLPIGGILFIINLGWKRFFNL